MDNRCVSQTSRQYIQCITLKLTATHHYLKQQPLYIASQPASLDRHNLTEGNIKDTSKSDTARHNADHTFTSFHTPSLYNGSSVHSSSTLTASYPIRYEKV